MADPQQSIATRHFDDHIHGRIESLRRTSICTWCKDPNRTIQNKSKVLCSSCSRWDKEQRKLAKKVEQLPPMRPRDPNWRLRWELDVANTAIELCKCDGRVRETKLDQVEPIDLEHLFDALSKRMRNKRKGPGPFHGKPKILPISRLHSVSGYGICFSAS
jgi:hypothetical protein